MTSNSDPARPARRRWPFVVGGALLAVVVAVVVIVVWVLPDDAKPAPKLQASDQGTGQEVPVASLAGTWTVVPGGSGSGDGTYAGYQVKEVFAAGARKVTARGHTGAVTGELTVANGSVTAAKVTVDTTTLTSDEGQRDRAIKGRGLETDRFPTAVFTLTDPVELPALRDGKLATVTATGTLTLHGETKPVSVELTVRPLGDTFAINGTIPVAFDDYGIEAPSVGGFVSVEDNGAVELLINFAKG